jgi:hypothetical protein
LDATPRLWNAICHAYEKRYPVSSAGIEAQPENTLTCEVDDGQVEGVLLSGDDTGGGQAASQGADGGTDAKPRVPPVGLDEHGTVKAKQQQRQYMDGTDEEEQGQRVSSGMQTRRTNLLYKKCVVWTWS